MDLLNLDTPKSTDYVGMCFVIFELLLNIKTTDKKKLRIYKFPKSSNE